MDFVKERTYWKRRLRNFLKTPGMELVFEPSHLFQHLYIDRSHYKSGTQYTVYTNCFWGSAPCVIKTVHFDLDVTEDDNISLFSEAIAHQYIQNKYSSKDRPCRIIPLLFVSWINISNKKYVCIGLEKFNHTLYRNKSRMTQNELRHAVRDIGTELYHWNTEWKFFHRDVHFGNIGWYSGRWHLFDVGMAMWKDKKRLHCVYSKKPFYNYTECPHITFDVQLLHMSSAIYLGVDFNRSTRQIIRQLYELPPNKWQRGIPLISSRHGNCRLSKIKGNNKVDILVEKQLIEVLLETVRVNERHPHTIYYLYKEPLPLMTEQPFSSVHHGVKCVSANQLLLS